MMTDIFSSKETYINWVVDNYHSQVVNNAISSGLINSDIPREELFYVLVNALDSGGYDQVVYALNVPLNLKDQPEDIRTQFARNIAPVTAPKMLRSGDFTGPPTLEDWEGEEGGSFDWDQFSDIFNTASGIFTSIWGSASGAGNSTPIQGQPNIIPEQPKDNTSMILIIAAVVMVLVLVVVLIRKK